MVLQDPTHRDRPKCWRLFILIMALRDQPYLPLYIQDFLTDEKLMECSASATGVYIRLMCIMHKSEKYGTILLKQKDKQGTKQVNNFASKVAKQMPYSLDVIENGLEELINEDVLQVDGDLLIQKRMVKDCNTSELRASAGAKGGSKTQQNNHSFASNFAKANNKANTEYEYDNENQLIKGEDEFLKIRTEAFENLPRDIYEKITKIYKIKAPIPYTHKTQFPIQQYDLVEWLADSIENDEWKQNLITRFGVNKKFSKAMVDYVNKLKTGYEYKDFKSTHDFRKYFSNWFNLNQDKY